MKAITVHPGVANSVTLSDVDPPESDDRMLLVQSLSLGVCGTDREIIEGLYGSAPKGEERLILGHESLGRVVEAPRGSAIVAGDLVVGLVRRPDPVPCPNCAAGEWDMCRNGQFTEHGIKDRHGFGAELWRIEPDRVVRVDPRLGALGVLLEPASVLAKAWEHIERIGGRAVWEPERVLVTGAGPIGLLAALMARQRGYEVDVLDQHTDGPKPQLVADLGATYHLNGVAGIPHRADVTLECTGAAQLVFDVMSQSGHGAVVCLTGVSSGQRTLSVDINSLNRSMVLENDVVFGTVNANRRHYELAADALTRADRSWLERIIMRRVPLENWREAFERRQGDVKTVIEFGI